MNIQITFPWLLDGQKGINANQRVVEDYVSFVDLAPTLLDAARINKSSSGMQSITGKSLFDIFYLQNPDKLIPIVIMYLSVKKDMMLVVHLIVGTLSEELLSKIFFTSETSSLIAGQLETLKPDI